MKSTDMLEWMNGLDARYLAESEQPAIRQHKKRLMPALIAAAAAAVCLTVGVGAYMCYNREMVQFGFGTLGEARMAELAAPEPVTCSNGRVSVTVENVLSDGKQAMLLLTLEPVDKTQPFDWTEFDEDQNHAMRNRFLIGGEEYQSDIATGRPSENVFSEDGTNEAYEIMKAADQRWIKMYFTLPEDASDKALADAVFECFTDAADANGQQYVNGDLFAGISIPVDLRQNADTVLMRSDDGKELTLSPFELYMVGYQAKHNDWWRLEITWKNGETQRIQHGDFAGSHQVSGAPTVTWGEFAVPTHDVIGSESVVGSIQLDSPEDWCGFIDVNAVAAFRFGDRMFYPVA